MQKMAILFSYFIFYLYLCPRKGSMIAEVHLCILIGFTLFNILNIILYDRCQCMLEQTGRFFEKKGSIPSS